MKQLTDNVFVETGLKGANHGLVTTSDGVVLIDTPHKPSDALRLIFLLLDIRRTPSDEDLQVSQWATSHGIDTRILLTKADKLSNNQLAARRSEIAKELAVDPQMLIACSTVTKQGIEEVRREIAKRL